MTANVTDLTGEIGSWQEVHAEVFGPNKNFTLNITGHYEGDNWIQNITLDGFNLRREVRYGIIDAVRTRLAIGSEELHTYRCDYFPCSQIDGGDDQRFKVINEYLMNEDKVRGVQQLQLNRLSEGFIIEFWDDIDLYDLSAIPMTIKIRNETNGENLYVHKFRRILLDHDSDVIKTSYVQKFSDDQRRNYQVVYNFTEV